MIKKLALIFILFEIGFAQQSPHGKIDITCETCHSTESWELRRDAVFNHNSTGFPLMGKHRFVECGTCHTNLVFSQQSPECKSCHTDIHSNELGQECLRCHTMDSWVITDMKQKHQQTRFPLVGQHALADCETCHKEAAGRKFAGTPLTCISCHKSEYEETVNPNHVTSGFPVDCSTCHKITSPVWAGSFDHNMTDFPLTGAHRSVLCNQCHENNQFVSRSTECYSCHQNDFATTLLPNHMTGGFSHDCRSCHNTNAWSPATFDHNATNFPLTGKHRLTECQSCHKNGDYQITFTSCNQCHQNDYQTAVNPNHVAGNFSRECQTCHSTSGWTPATFNHSATNFPLTGSHVSVNCITCHTNGNYQLTYTDCYQCHQSDYQAPTDPNHVSANFSHNCTQCHNTTSWSGATFNHASTQFPLTGKHSTATCASCHTNGNYQLTYTDCYQCHQSDYQVPTDPNHVSANFSHNCSQCHSTTSWSGASFDHSTTRFALTGSHIAVSCITCHTNGNYQLAYTDCYQCHAADFTTPTDPNHVSANFSHNCEQCHNTTAWAGATFDHASTQFPLTGRHLTVTCATCHANNNYQLAFTECYQCHQTDYQVPTNPNHVTANFSHDCTPCHTTTAWIPSTFNHDAQYFRIYSGRHREQWTTCADCHQNNTNYREFTCLTCHVHNQTDMNAKHSNVNGYSYTSPACYSCHRGV